jgi:hypothetical protein
VEFCLFSLIYIYGMYRDNFTSLVRSPKLIPYSLVLCSGHCAYLLSLRMVRMNLNILIMLFPSLMFDSFLLCLSCKIFLMCVVFSIRKQNSALTGF